MASKSIFPGASTGRSVPATDTTNKAGGRAYAFGPEHALAQLAVTGTFNDTYYGSGSDQLTAIREAADGCSPTFLAQCAVYARTKGFMKDMPAALMVMLSKADPTLFAQVFAHVIDNGKMIRNFVQITRSGAMGRKSLGNAGRREVRRWIRSRSPRALMRASVGKDGMSLADVIRLAHVRAKDPEQKALLGYLIGKPYDADALPQIAKDYEAFKRGETTEVPDGVDFRQLTSYNLSAEQWASVALRGGWTQTRMNLNTYARQGVFGLGKDAVTKLGDLVRGQSIEDAIAAKLRDPEEIKRARMFPYQLFAAYLNAEENVPFVIREALQDAMDVAIENVPTFDTQVHVVVDVSGSMHSSVTGTRKGATSKVRCIDVAGLFGAVMLRRNPGSTITPVHGYVVPCTLNPRDSVMTNAKTLASTPGGATNLGAAMQHLNQKSAKGDLVVVVSDNMSWVDSSGYGRGSGLMQGFRTYQKRNPKAKLVCIDIAPYGSTQAPDAPDEVLNVGGFSDSVFDVVRKFVLGEGEQKIDPEGWVGEIKSIDLSALGAAG